MSPHLQIQDGPLRVPHKIQRTECRAIVRATSLRIHYTLADLAKANPFGIMLLATELVLGREIPDFRLITRRPNLDMSTMFLTIFYIQLEAAPILPCLFHPPSMMLILMTPIQPMTPHRNAMVNSVSTIIEIDKCRRAWSAGTKPRSGAHPSQRPSIVYTCFLALFMNLFPSIGHRTKDRCISTGSLHRFANILVDKRRLGLYHECLHTPILM
jgi:hypothetical protein